MEEFQTLHFPNLDAVSNSAEVYDDAISIYNFESDYEIEDIQCNEQWGAQFDKLCATLENNMPKAPITSGNDKRMCA